MKTAYFNRFTLALPDEAINACSHQGDCYEDCKAWSTKISRPSEITPTKLACELSEYGSWTLDELQDDQENWIKLLWIAACQLKDEEIIEL